MGATTNRPVLVLAGIVLSALALRPQIIAIGPLVDAIDTDLGVSHTVTGLLGTIPLLCIGIFAPAAGPLAARVGATRAASAAASRSRWPCPWTSPTTARRWRQRRG